MFKILFTHWTSLHMCPSTGWIQHHASISPNRDRTQYLSVSSHNRTEMSHRERPGIVWKGCIGLVNMRRRPSIGSMLVHCLRRWPNIKPTSGEYSVLTEVTLPPASASLKREENVMWCSRRRTRTVKCGLWIAMSVLPERTSVYILYVHKGCLYSPIHFLSFLPEKIIVFKNMTVTESDLDNKSRKMTITF